MGLGRLVSSIGFGGTVPQSLSRMTAFTGFGSVLALGHGLKGLRAPATKRRCESPQGHVFMRECTFRTSCYDECSHQK
eukprot:4276095-Amphidinium_carterae.1